MLNFVILYISKNRGKEEKFKKNIMMMMMMKGTTVE